MTRYVIDPEVALHLAPHDVPVVSEHQLVAPTLLRSQLLSVLYKAVRRGEMTKSETERHLDYTRRLRTRLLGNRVLQAVAWKIADQLGGADTYDAEYIALTQLQADALSTLDPTVADAAKGLVTLAPLDALT